MRNISLCIFKAVKNTFYHYVVIFYSSNSIAKFADAILLTFNIIHHEEIYLFNRPYFL